MKISIIVANTKKKSFNHAIAETAANTLKAGGHEVFFHDLYQERFNPSLPEEEISANAVLDESVKKYCDEIAASDGLIIVHPNWWGMPPAILKGWVDRVLRDGIAYRFQKNDSGEGVPVGLLKVKAALVFNTSNTPEEREKEVFGDPLEGLWIKCILQFCGIKNILRRNFSVVVASNLDQRKQWLQEVETLVKKAFS